MKELPGSEFESNMASFGRELASLVKEIRVPVKNWVDDGNPTAQEAVSTLDFILEDADSMDVRSNRKLSRIGSFLMDVEEILQLHDDGINMSEVSENVFESYHTNRSQSPLAGSFSHLDGKSILDIVAELREYITKLDGRMPE